jgi:hypothetical protein
VASTGESTLKPLSIGIVACLASVWLVVNTMLTAAAGTMGPALVHFRFFSKLLDVWGSTSAIGLQAMVERLQIVSMGILMAPLKLQGLRTLGHSVDWATMGWAGGRCCLGAGRSASSRAQA